MSLSQLFTLIIVLFLPEQEFVVSDNRSVLIFGKLEMCIIVYIFLYVAKRSYADYSFEECLLLF